MESKMCIRDSETTASGGVSGAVLDAADGGDAGEGVGGRGRPYGARPAAPFADVYKRQVKVLCGMKLPTAIIIADYS